MWPLENLTVCFVANFPYSRKIDLLRWESWDTQPLCIDSFSKATGPLTPLFFDFFTGLTINLNVSKSAFFAFCASWFRLVNWETREGANNYMTASCPFPNETSERNSASFSRRTFPFAAWTFWGYLSVSVCLRFWCRRRRLSFWFLIASVSRCSIVTETTWVSFRTLSECFPLIACSHFPPHADFSPLWLLVTAPPSTISFRALKLCDPISLSSMTSYYCLQSEVLWWFVVSNILLHIHRQHSVTLNRIL